MIIPKPGENKCWRVFQEDLLPQRVALGYDGHSNYGWSLGTGRVPWSKVFSTEREALEATRKLRVATLNQLTKDIAQIDARIVKLAKP